MIPAVLALSLLAGAPEVERFALVIGVNESVDPGVPALSFADNDAARYAALFEAGAARVELLAVLDGETQGRFPEQAARARPPTRAELERALDELFTAMKAAQREGREADLLFVYAGHGAVGPGGEGYVSLLDGRLTRADLFATVVERSPARFNHLIIDACSAFHLVNRGARDVRAVRSLLARSSLAAHPNTGALLATSRDRATHEWSRVEGGVFSHQVLSALSGAADADLDGELSYAELGAFVEAANEGVADRRARVDVFVQPPRLYLERPLWRVPEAPVLTLPLAATGHFAVHDGRGVAVAELHKGQEQATNLHLLGSAPFTVARGDQLWTLSEPLARQTSLDPSEARSAETRERSAVAHALERGLFTVPFGPSYVRGYRARLAHEQKEPEEVLVVAAPATGSLLVWTTAGLAGASVLAAGAGAALYGMAAFALESGRGVLNGRTAQSWQAAGNTGLGVALGGATLGLALAATSIALGLATDPAADPEG